MHTPWRQRVKSKKWQGHKKRRLRKERSGATCRRTQHVHFVCLAVGHLHSCHSLCGAQASACPVVCTCRCDDAHACARGPWLVFKCCAVHVQHEGCNSRVRSAIGPAPSSIVQVGSRRSSMGTSNAHEGPYTRVLCGQAGQGNQLSVCSLAAQCGLTVWLAIWARTGHGGAYGSQVRWTSTMHFVIMLPHPRPMLLASQHDCWPDTPSQAHAALDRAKAIVPSPPLHARCCLWQGL